VLLPAAVAVLVAISDRNTVLRDGEDSAKRTVLALSEHLKKVLETQVLLLQEVDAQIEGRSWQDIERDDKLRRNLNAAAARLPQVRAIWIVDERRQRRQYGNEQGRVYTKPAGIEEQEHFRALRDSSRAGVHVSRSFSTDSGRRVFVVSTRRTTADGQFAGIICSSISLDYFTSFWQQFTPTTDHVVPLVRADGAIISRHPATEGPSDLPIDGPFRKIITRSGSAATPAYPRSGSTWRWKLSTRIWLERCSRHQARNPPVSQSCLRGCTCTMLRPSPIPLPGGFVRDP
jgi:hypothetical protein